MEEEKTAETQRRGGSTTAEKVTHKLPGCLKVGSGFCKIISGFATCSWA